MSGAESPVRRARREDRDEILSVVEAAFATGENDASEELAIVRATWESRALLGDLELVATLEGAVVGHVLVAMGSMAGAAVPGVAPLSVAPGHQGRGIGSALMRALVERADAAGLPMLVVLGSPAYYSRFGFEPAAPLGVVYPPAGPASPYFQLRQLGAYDPARRGEYAYCWETP